MELNITITENDTQASIAKVITALQALVGVVETKPAPTKADPKPEPKVETKPAPTKTETKPATSKVETKPDEVNTEAANDRPAPQADAVTNLRDLAKKLIVKDRAAMSAIFAKFGVKLLSELPADKIEAATAEVEAALL